MKKRVILSIGLATAIFTGCGSSSAGETQTGTGYYIDSAVSGVNYSCGSKTGKTGADGSFTFEVGKNCTFSLGSMKLREVKADKLKDQIKVLENNLAVATLLQTLDSDGDPDNDGILISEKILAELKAKNITTLPTNQDEVAVIYEVIKNVEGYQGSLKTKEEAQAHLNGETPTKNLKTILDGKTWGEYRIGASTPKSCYIFNGETITGYFDGDNTKSLELTYSLNNNVIQYRLNGEIAASTDTFVIVNDTELNVNKVWANDEDNRVWKITSNCITIMQN